MQAEPTTYHRIVRTLHVGSTFEYVDTMNASDDEINEFIEDHNFIATGDTDNPGNWAYVGLPQPSGIDAICHEWPATDDVYGSRLVIHFN